MKLSELVKEVGGLFEGPSDPEISGVGTLEDAGPSEVAFYQDERYRNELVHTNAAAVFVKNKVEGVRVMQIMHLTPYLAFARAMRIFHPPSRPEPGISPLATVEGAEIGTGSTVLPYAFIGPGSRLGRNCIVHPYAYIGPNVRMKDDCIVFPHVSIREGTRIGNRCIFQDGCRIGTDGFGFAVEENGKLLKIPQVGSVVIEDDVEIGANCSIDRATLSMTLIGADTKFDNLVQIGHNVRIGKGCRLVAQVGIAGSSRLGDNVILAGQVGVADHITIGDNATVGAKSGVTRDLAGGSLYVGFPAIPYNQWRAIQHRLIHPDQPEKENNVDPSDSHS